MFLDLLVNGFFQGVPIAIAALGFALIWYASKEFHFLYGVMLAAAGFGLYSLVGAGANLFLALVIVVVIASIIGAVLEYWFYRRLGSPLSVLLFSFGLAIVLQNVLQILYGPQDVVLSHNDLASRSVMVVPFADITRQANDVVAFGALVVVWVGIGLLMTRTDFGLGLQAVMTDPEAAQYVGVRPARMRAGAYALGSAIGALAGALSMVGFGVRPTTGFDVMLFAFMATFLGGGVLMKVPAWGLVVGALPSVLAWQVPTNFNTLITFVIMLTYVVVRRQLPQLPAIVRGAFARRRLPTERGLEK